MRGGNRVACTLGALDEAESADTHRRYLPFPPLLAEALRAAADAIEESNADRSEDNIAAPVLLLVTDAPPHGLLDPKDGEERFPEGTRVNLWDQASHTFVALQHLCGTCLPM